MQDQQQPPYKQRISEPLHVEAPRPALGLFHRGSGRVAIRHGEQRLGVIEQPPSIKLQPTQIRIAGRRMRLDRPDDWTVGEMLGNVIRAPFGMPRRRRIWRAGAGVVTQIQETSESRERLTASFEVEGEPYQVVCVPYTALGREYDRQLFAPGGLLAVMERSEFVRHEFFLTPRKPTRLDVLALAVHLMFWLIPAAGGAAGGAGGGGGGGGGGDGGGGC